MTEQNTTCHCDEGWICEAHPDQPWPHGDCGGPGMPCASTSCPWWKGNPAALDTSDWTNVVTADGRRLDRKPS